MIKRSEGFVSLLTTVILALLLTVIIISLTSLMIGELRQAIDSENSIKAYYAAEAGAEDAILKIINTISSGGSFASIANTCNSDNFGANEYTCQQISVATNLPKGSLKRESPLQFDLYGLDITQIDVDWNQASCAGENVCEDGRLPFNPGANFGPGSTYVGPAVMELAAVSYPDSAIPGLTVRELVFKPLCPPGCASAPGPANSPIDINASGPQGVNCYAAKQTDGYNCHATITGFTTDNYVIRIRPRYNGAHYQMRFYTSAGQVMVPDQFATIDVTGKAGDSYRRIVEKVKIRSGAFAGLDYVLYSDADICKNLTVTSGGSGGGSVSPGCTY